MPKLVALGIPEEIWLEAREISVRARPGYWLHTYSPKRCKRGHEMTAENTIVKTAKDKRAVHGKTYINCSLCVQVRYEGRLQKVSSQLCSSCGRFPPAPYRKDKLCGTCAHRKLKFGDPAPRGGIPPVRVNQGSLVYLNEKSQRDSAGLSRG